MIVCEILESESIGVHSVFLAVALSVAVVRWIMDKILIKYQGNGSSRYDEKEYFESASELRREKKHQRTPFTCQLGGEKSLHAPCTYL